jgi:iron only hydrogenase large subunit-like protein
MDNTTKKTERKNKEVIEIKQVLTTVEFTELCKLIDKLNISNEKRYTTGKYEIKLQTSTTASKIEYTTARDILINFVNWTLEHEDINTKPTVAVYNTQYKIACVSLDLPSSSTLTASCGNNWITDRIMAYKLRGKNPFDLPCPEFKVKAKTV